MESCFWQHRGGPRPRFQGSSYDIAVSRVLPMSQERRRKELRPGGWREDGRTVLAGGKRCERLDDLKFFLTKRRDLRVRTTNAYHSEPHPVPSPCGASQHHPGAGPDNAPQVTPSTARSPDIAPQASRRPQLGSQASASPRYPRAASTAAARSAYRRGGGVPRHEHRRGSSSALSPRTDRTIWRCYRDGLIRATITP